MPEEVVVLSFISIVAVTSLAFGLMRSVNRHLDRKWRARHGTGEQRALSELEELRSRVERIEDIQLRVGELEERVDFAERLLADGKNRGAIHTER